MFEYIYKSLIEYLQGEYTVIKSYDAEQNIDLDGVIAVNLNTIQNAHNGDLKDFRLNVTINGQTFTEQDKDKSKIISMFDYVFDKVTPTVMIQHIPYCVGIVPNNGGLQSDGETNNFTFSIDLFISPQVD